MAEIAGSAIVKLGVDTKQLDKGLNEAETKTKSGLSKLGSAAKSAAIGAAAAASTAVASATAAITGLAASSINAYADFEQSVGGIETLFGNAAETVLANADTAFERAQINANQYMEQATSFSASLIQSLGGDTKKAAEYADRAIVDMADNANKMGTSIEAIQNAYQGFAKQNYTMLDNLKLGYGGTKTEAERLIRDASQMTEEMEKLGVVVDADSTDFANLVNAISVVQEHMGIAGTTAIEATETIAGSTKMLKASWQDLVRGFADPDADLTQLFDNLTKSAIAFGNNIGKAILRTLPNVVKAVKTLVEKISEKLPSIVSEMLPPLMESIGDLASTLLQQLPTLIQGFITVATQVVIGIAQQLPTLLQSLVQGIMGIVTVLTQPENIQAIMRAGIELLLGLVQAIPQVITALVEALPDIIMNIIDFLTDPAGIALIAEASIALFEGIVKAVPAILGALFNAFVELFNKLKEKLKTVIKSFTTDFGKGIGNALVTALNKVLEFIENRLNDPVHIINAAIDALNNLPGVSINALPEVSLPRIPALATGGVATRATMSLIGEAGPEAVIPLTKDTGWAKSIASQLATEFASEGFSSARTVNVYMTNEINSELDADEIGQKLITSIRRAI